MSDIKLPDNTRLDIWKEAVTQVADDLSKLAILSIENGQIVESFSLTFGYVSASETDREECLTYSIGIRQDGQPHYIYGEMAINSRSVIGSIKAILATINITGGILEERYFRFSEAELLNAISNEMGLVSPYKIVE
jgi:hypothetical protein